MRLCDLLLTVSPPPFKKSWWHPIILVMPHSKMSKTWFYLIAVFALKHASSLQNDPHQPRKSNHSKPSKFWCPSPFKIHKKMSHFLTFEFSRRKFIIAFLPILSWKFRYCKIWIFAPKIGVFLPLISWPFLARKFKFVANLF